jgi:hypothetical protein
MFLASDHIVDGYLRPSLTPQPALILDALRSRDATRLLLQCCADWRLFRALVTQRPHDAKICRTNHGNGKVRRLLVVRPFLGVLGDSLALRYGTRNSTALRHHPSSTSHAFFRGDHCPTDARRQRLLRRKDHANSMTLRDKKKNSGCLP